jgi:hypothetical protein
MSAMLGSIALTAYATGNDEGNSAIQELWGWGQGFRGGARMRGGRGCSGFVEVSEAYNETVINIVKSDQDVQNLLAEGYSISVVRPIIKTTVEADGSVVMKATNAIVLLSKDTTAKATAWVDLSAGKVTKIVTMTMTVIDKS